MSAHPDYLKNLRSDLPAALVVFLVALPLCLGIALASGAPLISGLVAGIVGGVLVSWVSGSHASISGPAAGLTAVVATQIDALGSYEAFLVAVVMAGAIQIGMGLMRAGSLAAFFPSSVIKGLLAAIGIILILKQIPHLFGHDPDWLGDMSFMQPDGQNTFSELIAMLSGVHPGAALIGLLSLAVLIAWDKTALKKLPVPGPLVVVVGGVAMAFAMRDLGPLWAVTGAHLVVVPVADSVGSLVAMLPTPDFGAITRPQAFVAAITVALVASLETLLNLEAIDKLDPRKRVSPPNRELVAQGAGNLVSGLAGGLPLTSVIIRSSVGINAGSRTRMTSFLHGVLLLGLVAFMPGILNTIPLSCLAAVLLVTGFKLASPALFRKMWGEGRNQFLPFIATVVAIVLTDLLIGIVIGLVGAVLFILASNLHRPLRWISEQHVSGEVLRIEFANQVSFLNRASLSEALQGIPPKSQVVLDARNTVYMDADILDLIREFEEEIAPAHEIRVSLLGFQDHYDVEDRITYLDVSTREVQDRATPEQILKLLMDGNERFVTGQTIVRDPRRQVDVTSAGQYPLAVVLACMDSRMATEMIFDVGLGDIFSIRVAGNIASEQALGSIEYGCAVAGAKLVLVMGHTRCGAVTATVDLVAKGGDTTATGDLENLSAITGPIGQSVHAEDQTPHDRTAANAEFVRSVTVVNIRRTMRDVQQRSGTIRKLIAEGRIRLAGALYDVETGRVTILDNGE